jgi:hypothetical protein
MTKDLEFKPTDWGGHAAYVDVVNNYALSIVYGGIAKCDENTFEVAVMYKHEIDYKGFGDPLGYQTPEQIEQLIQKIKNKYMENKVDYITPIKDQLDENMHLHCSVFITIGSQIETPRYYNYGGYDEETKKIKIRSTQTDRLFFWVDISDQSEEYINDFMYTIDIVSEFWAQFKEYRTNFLKENYPTIDRN